jgi:hypothetical protein
MIDGFITFAKATSRTALPLSLYHIIVTGGGHGGEYQILQISTTLLLFNQLFNGSDSQGRALWHSDHHLGGGAQNYVSSINHFSLRSGLNNPAQNIGKNRLLWLLQEDV